MRLLAPIALCTLLAATPLAAQIPAPTGPDPNAIEAVGILSSGVQNHDGRTAAAAYADDAMVLPPNGEVVKGKTNIEAFWTAQFDAGLNAVDGGSNGLTTSGDLGYEWGVATFELRVKGAVITEPVKYVNILRKDAAGKWKIAITTWNSSKPRE